MKTINETADKVKEVLNEAINSAVKGLKEDVGKCRVLYSSLETLHGTVCKTVLYPFNGFWYSIGWCLFFFIPSIIFAMLLAGQYRKTEEYDPKRDDFDQSNYEEDYQGAFPGDHIALDDMSRRRGKQERNGVSNAGYDDRRGGGGGYPYNSGGGGGDRYDDNRYKGTPSGGYGRGYDGYHDNRSYGGGYGGRGSYDRSDSYVEPVAPPSYHAAAYGNHWQNNRHY
ncbi:uncharacterized protein LOC106168322 [Lingula anatina]|uniref:Uncharacterized protein LOC106168322 n=1 Tax=Lingula anatina TaxID=7574 RepID=A0A1S3IX74_LINAN|nr:uncharacterized protein LOC106168322 [Lingula anatina]|eukprot:XP_013402802.1 uncharacterized protein LOC106168322 [Lingula anatina]